MNRTRHQTPFILLASLTLIIIPTTVSAQPVPAAIVSIDLVSPVYAALTDVDAAVKGYATAYSSFLLNLQLPTGSKAAVATTIGFERQSYVVINDE